MQLSSTSAMFWLLFCSCESSFFTHISKIAAVIQAFLFDSYGKGSFLMFLKHGLADLPITRRGNFSPAMLAVTSTVNLSFKSFPSAQLSFLKTLVLSGKHQ